MDKISKQFPILSRQKTTDIFLKVDNKMTKLKIFKIERFIRIAKKFNIRVHISISTFFDGQKFINPIKNGVKYTCFMNEIIKKAKDFASLKNIAGIHFEYLRYQRNAFKYNEGINAINYFVKKAVIELKKKIKI